MKGEFSLLLSGSILDSRHHDFLKTYGQSISLALPLSSTTVSKLWARLLCISKAGRSCCRECSRGQHRKPNRAIGMPRIKSKMKTQRHEASPIRPFMLWCLKELGEFLKRCLDLGSRHTIQIGYIQKTFDLQ